MFCVICGHTNTDDAVYCNKCGRRIEREQETVVAKKNIEAEVGSDDVQIFSITPTLKFVIVGYVLAAIGAFFVSALFSVLIPGVTVWVGVALGMSLFLIPALYHVRQRLSRYTLMGSKIEIDHGLISRTTQNIPLRRIQDVTVSATISQRLLGLGDVVVDNAGTDGGRIVFKNVDSPRKYADMLLKQMRRIE